jgi:hypothetical protein
MDVSAEEAKGLNAAVPTFDGPLELPRPFALPDGSGTALSSKTAHGCLTAAIYYEAAGQPAAGQRGVAQVVLNRVRHPAYPKTICGVVYQGWQRTTGCQFTFTCDGSLARRPAVRNWGIAAKIADAMLAGAVEPSVGVATHYHADYVVPYWASSLQKLAILGNHIFYKHRGYWGQRAAYRGVYLGGEMEPRAGTVPRLDVMAEGLADDQVGAPVAASKMIPDGVRRLELETGALSSDRVLPLQADRDRGELILDRQRR